MSNYAVSLKRTSILLAALSFAAVLFAANFWTIFSARASAEQLTGRSLAISSTLSGTVVGSGVSGAPDNGSEATHEFTFTPVTTGATTVTFQYCTDAVGTCTTPTGLAMSATPAVGTGGGTAAYATGTITWTPGSALTTAQVVVSFTDITNPTFNASPTNPDDNTFFVRITTNAGDDGTVANAVTQGIVITSRVAETLGFSVSGALTDAQGGDTAPGANCAPLTGSGAITIGDPTANTLALGTTYDNYSGFRIYTNAANTTLIQYRGDTLRRGGAVDIEPVGPSLFASAPGTEQFGLGIDLVNGGDYVNDAANDVAIASSTTNRDLSYYGVESGNAGDGEIDGGAGAGGITVLADYLDGAGTVTNGGTASFAFVGDADSNVDPDLAMPATTVATGSGYITCSSAAVRYIANISPTTPAGTYTTTIVYSAVPTY